MKRKSIAVALAALLSVPTGLQADPATQSTKSGEDSKLRIIEDLERQNAALKNEIQRLQNRVANLQSQLDANALKQWQLEIKPLDPKEPQLHITPLPTQPLTITPPSLQTLPPGTVEGKINGEPFYVIPISGNVSAGCTTVAVPTAAVAKAKK